MLTPNLIDPDAAAALRKMASRLSLVFLARRSVAFTHSRYNFRTMVQKTNWKVRCGFGRQSR